MMKKIGWTIFILMMIFFVAWVALSYCEIILKNTTGAPKYFPFNIFKMLGA